jgi:hypothetical protein
VRKFVACLALLVSCEPFEADTDMQRDARTAFELWRDDILAGRMAEAVQAMTYSYKSQWVYDRLVENDPAALQWRTKLKGNARTDIDLWLSETGASSARGRVHTLPPTVLSDPSVNVLLIGYLREAALELQYEFKRVKVVESTADNQGVSILIHNSRGEPEMYALVIEGGMWKLDHHRSKPQR